MQLENIILETALVIVPPLLVFWFTWFLTRRHFQKKNLTLKDIEIKDRELDVINKEFKLFKDMIEDVDRIHTKALEYKNEEIVKLKLKIKELQNKK